MHSLEIVQWDSTRRDHPGNLGGVFGSGPVNDPLDKDDTLGVPVAWSTPENLRE